MIASIGNPSVAAAILLVAIYCYSKYKHGYWKRRGIKGPEPLPLFGNLFDLMLGDRLKKQRDWVQRYGKVYGIFYGIRPKLVIADPELAVQICIKDFDHFQNHELNEFNNETGRNSLFYLQDERWKRVRTLMSPTFTSSKMKRMFSLLDGCADDLLVCFAELMTVNNQVVNLKDVYSLFTMDAITTCCYGLKYQRAGSTNLKMAASRDNFVEDAMRIFSFSIWRFAVSILMPKPILRAINYSIRPEKEVVPLINRVKTIIERRRQSGQKVDDLLQLLIDARLGTKLELDELDSAENHHAGLTQESLEKDQAKFLNDLAAGSDSGLRRQQLTDIELLSNATLLLTVGLETSGTLLSHTSYALAYHPEIQKKLYDELIEIVEFNEDKTVARFQYESLTSCKYLDAVLSECLRLLSPLVWMTRQVSKDYYLEKFDLNLRVGDRIHVYYHALHTNPDYWQDPLSFDPERFMPENKDKIVPGSYLPFGLGPRHCIGMRFSLTESKLALAKIMMRYRFEPAPGTSWPPKQRPTLLLNKIAVPLVKCVDRSSALV